MEEILALILEGILEGDVLPLGMVVVSEEIVSEIAITAAELGEMYTEIVSSFGTFQTWCATNLVDIPEVVKQIIGLQMLFSMIHHHWDLASNENRGVDVETALQDIEATLVQQHARMVDLARRTIAGPKFANLPLPVQADLQSLVSTTPGAFWVSVKVGIMQSLLKMPIYSK